MLGTDAVQRAGRFQFERAEDQLRGVGGEHRRGDAVQARTIPDREAAARRERIGDRGGEVAEAGVLGARRRRARAMDALDGGDAGDGSALAALGDDELRRRFEEAVGVDRVRRLVLGGRALVPSKTQSVDTRTTCAPTRLAACTTARVAPTYAVQATSAVRDEAGQVVPDRGVDDAVRAPGLGIPADGIRVGDVELGAAGREDIDVVPGEDLDDIGADEPEPPVTSTLIR